MSKQYTPVSAAHDVEAALRLLEGRWKLVILSQAFIAIHVSSLNQLK